MGVISPSVQTYATVTPYITEDEFKNTPTALETTDLIQGGTGAQQDQAIKDAILRASSWADQLVKQVLAATLDTDYGRFRINREGIIKVPLKYKPVLEVQAISVGLRPSGMVALLDYSDVAILEHGIIEVPVMSQPGPLLTNRLGAMGVGSRPLVQVDYVNGWPNTTLAATAAAADTSITVDSPLGVYPGSGLTIYDGAGTEQIQVSSTYVPGSSTVTLAGPLANNHQPGASVSALPPRVKSAVVLLTVALIQTRGDDSIILDAMETPGRMSSSYGAAGANVDIAKGMLSDVLTRVW